METSRRHERLFEIETNRKIMRTPFFFPAVSTVKTNLELMEYLRLLRRIDYPGFLVSSYDIYHAGEKEKERVLEYVSESTHGETLTLLDSGYYEAYWHRDREWNIENLEPILNEIAVDFCFSSDVFWDEKTGVRQHAGETITSIARTAGMQRSGTTIPLIHSNPQSFPEIVRMVVEGINPEIVGVPERELGASIFERATTVRRIRDELDKTKQTVPLHILGAGHPISILIYTLCGADIYDALEWCTTTVDRRTGGLYHFIQREMLDCSCTACRMKDMAYHTQTIAHNLVFYLEYTEKIRSAIEENKVGEILKTYVPPSGLKKVERLLGSKWK